MTNMLKVAVMRLFKYDNWLVIFGKIKILNTIIGESIIYIESIDYINLKWYN